MLCQLSKGSKTFLTLLPFPLALKITLRLEQQSRQESRWGRYQGKNTNILWALSPNSLCVDCRLCNRKSVQQLNPPFTSCVAKYDESQGGQKQFSLAALTCLPRSPLNRSSLPNSSTASSQAHNTSLKPYIQLSALLGKLKELCTQ